MFDRLHTEPVYNTRAVVQRTGVPADTFRAWERRYSLPSPCRTEGNQRLYSEQDVAIICWLRDQTRAGMTISHAVSLYRSLLRVNSRDLPNPVAAAESARTEYRYSVEPLPAMQTPRTAIAPPASRPSYFHTCLELISALSCYDALTAERILEEAIALTSVESVCHEVLRPAMTEIRRRRAADALSGSAEHFARAFMLRKVNALFNLSHPEIGRGPVVAACVEGDHDELDLLYTSLFLSRGGFSVVYLGSDLSTGELRQAVESLHPLLVILCASSDALVQALAQAVDALHATERDRESPAIGFGGEVFVRRPELRQRIDAPFLGSDGYQAVAACERLIGSLTSDS